MLIIGNRARSADYVRSKAPREGDNLGSVAVGDFEHGRPALRLAAEVPPHRAFTPLVDGLDVVVDDHQRFRARVYHLGRKRKPLRLEVVGLVNQDSVVLFGWDMSLIYSLHDL